MTEKPGQGKTLICTHCGHEVHVPNDAAVPTCCGVPMKEKESN